MKYNLNERNVMNKDKFTESLSSHVKVNIAAASIYSPLANSDYQRNNNRATHSPASDNSDTVLVTPASSPAS